MMTIAEAKRRAAKNMTRRMGASVMPLEVTVVGLNMVQAYDPETGSVATFSIIENGYNGRLYCTRFRDKR